MLQHPAPLDTPIGPLTFRGATESDFPLLRRLHKAAMHESITATGGWNDEQQAVRLRRHWRPERLLFLLQDNTAVGCLNIARRGDVFTLEQFYLDPVVQGQGVGGALMAKIIPLAGDSPIRLETLKKSRARAFYERHGFVVDGEDDWNWQMVRRPAPAA